MWVAFADKRGVLAELQFPELAGQDLSEILQGCDWDGDSAAALLIETGFQLVHPLSPLLSMSM